MKKQWNSAQWQGRSKRQVESNYQIMDWIVAGFGIFMIGLIIYNLIFSI